MIKNRVDSLMLMNKNLIIISILVTAFTSCKKENETQNNNPPSQTIENVFTALNDNKAFGRYSGVFVRNINTDAWKTNLAYRKTGKFVIEIRNKYSTAVFKDAGGTILYEYSLSTVIQEGQDLSLTFENGSNTKFTFSVKSNGENPTISGGAAGNISGTTICKEYTTKEISHFVGNLTVNSPSGSLYFPMCFSVDKNKNAQGYLINPASIQTANMFPTIYASNQYQWGLYTDASRTSILTISGSQVSGSVQGTNYSYSLNKL
jgi:hypothetical protein